MTKTLTDMIRFLFSVLLLVHGLIHLMGFAKAFKYAEIDALQLPVSRPAGVLWLASAVLFATATVLFALKKDSWWMAALPAIALSQALILGAWQDAKFGTIANVLVLAGVALAYGNWQFRQQLRQERQAFRNAVPVAERILTRQDLAGLPPIVQQWLERSNCLGKPQAQMMHLRQQGSMRTSPGGKWIPFTAEQYTLAGEPAFFWTTEVTMAPYLTLAGRDLYRDGKGHMLIKLLSLFPVADARGPETDQGTLLRFMGELVWMPSAAVNDYLRWEPGPDSLSAKATLRYGGMEASGLFRFTPDGDFDRFEARRYYDRKGGATLENWQVQADPAGYRDFEDIRIPARSVVTWKLDSGDYTWLQLDITELRYNRHMP